MRYAAPSSDNVPDATSHRSSECRTINLRMLSTGNESDVIAAAPSQAMLSRTASARPRREIAASVSVDGGIAGTASTTRVVGFEGTSLAAGFSGLDFWATAGCHATHANAIVSTPFRTTKVSRQWLLETDDSRRRRVAQRSVRGSLSELDRDRCAPVRPGCDRPS